MEATLTTFSTGRREPEAHGPPFILRVLDHLNPRPRGRASAASLVEVPRVTCDPGALQDRTLGTFPGLSEACLQGQEIFFFFPSGIRRFIWSGRGRAALCPLPDLCAVGACVPRMRLTNGPERWGAAHHVIT